MSRPAHSGRAAMCLLLFVTLTGCCGCTNAKFLHRTCPAPPNPRQAANTPAPDAAYCIGCADVLEVIFDDFPEWNAIASVGVDGRLPLETPGSPRVEGLTTGEVSREFARLVGVSEERIHVSLAAVRSSHIYVHGPIRGRCRPVPYQGPEPVINFLKRVGGLPPGSKLNQVYVVRPNIAVGSRPEVFPVDVAAVLLDNDMSTNVLLRASDQIYIGETRGSSFSRLLPEWLGPLYRKITGLLPDDWWPFSRPRLGPP